MTFWTVLLTFFFLVDPASEGLADEGSVPFRLYLSGVTGQFQTPIMLQSTEGSPIEGKYQSPEQGFALGFQLDIDRKIAIDLKLLHIQRDISYTQSNGFDSVTSTFQTRSIHVPAHILLIPKRWIHFGLGGYVDYPYQSDIALGLDAGISLLGGVDIPFGKNMGKWGMTLGVQHNISLYTYSNISPREFLFLWSLRFRGNKQPSFE